MVWATLTPRVAPTALTSLVLLCQPSESCCGVLWKPCAVHLKNPEPPMSENADLHFYLHRNALEVVLKFPNAVLL